MRKYVFTFIFILLCIIPLSVSAAEYFSYSFDSREETAFWSGGIFDDTNSFENGHCIFVNNPFGEVKNNRVTHVIDYEPTITLEAGKVYTLSGYVMNPASSYNPSIRSNSSLGAGANIIIVSVSGIGDDWSHFSTTFFAGESGEYNLAIHLFEGFSDFGFFVDELKLYETECTLSSLKISGPGEILIPATGSIKHYYRLYILTTDDKIVDILSSNNIYFSVTDSPGIAFNSREFSLSVDSQAKSDIPIIISCVIKNYADLYPTTITINLTDNMIENPHFDEPETLWTSSSKIKLKSENAEKYIEVPVNDYGEFGYFATITYDNSQLLIKDVLYVIRARIKSDIADPFSAIHAKNSAENDDNTIYFSIKDISGEEWVDVFASFIPDETGVYNIALNLCSAYDCTIFVDDIKLSSEVIAPEYITLHAPGNIALPNISTSYPVSALLRDQLGNIISSDNIDISLSANDGSLQFDSSSNLLTVNPDTTSGQYELKATYIADPSISSTLNFTVSFDMIGDGTFETTIPNEWWMVSSPYACDLYMRYDGHSRRALINCKGNYFMLLNNSYVHLIKDSAYVFNADFSAPINCTGILFLETLDKKMLPLAQFSIEAGSTLNEKRFPELFLAEENAVGRLFLYVESDSGQPFSIYADNLSLKNASIVAANPRITGIPFVNGAAEAEFSLFNSITGDHDTSACAVNWYVSDTAHGPYSEIYSIGKNIYFDTTFLNKYVCFEVIPVCPVTGFSGTPIRSFPFQITYDASGSNSEMRFKSILTTPVSYENHFSDTESHWAEDAINILAYNGVVSGKSKNTFNPDSEITKAEFSKMLSIAFSLNTVADLPSFRDIKRADWYYNYVTSLYLAGIVNGNSAGLFSPDNFLSREEAAVMIIRLYEKATYETLPAEKIHFSDNEDISDWAITHVNKAVTLGIIKGNDDNSIAAKKPLTRAEACVLICRLAEILKGK